MKKFFKYTLRTLAVLVVLLLAAFLFFNKKRPTGNPGDGADRLAQKMLLAVNKTAWDSTAWVKWTYADRNTIVWDKKNGVAQVSWEDMKVRIITADQTGTVRKNGIELTGKAANEARASAWSRFCNDSFWLCAPAKAFDGGTERSLVPLENGKMGLKVQYTTGGVTPGDAYLWELDDSGLPVRYEMWVKIVPMGGLSSTWDNWVTLPTGAKISTLHKIAGRMEVRVTNLESGMGAANFGD